MKKMLLAIYDDHTVFIDVFILCFRTFLAARPTYITSLIGIEILTVLVEQIRLMSLMSMFLAPVVAFKLLSNHNTLKYLSYHNILHISLPSNTCHITPCINTCHNTPP